MDSQKLFYKKIREYERSHGEKRTEFASSKEIFDYISSILKEDEVENEPPLPARTEKIVVSEPSHESVVRKKEKRVVKKRKAVNGHTHYSSSSEEEYSEEVEDGERTAPEKEVDDNGNEVISTSNDIWKTSVEVEHTETENMDDFINQLFM